MAEKDPEDPWEKRAEYIKQEGWRRALAEASDMGYEGEQARKVAEEFWGTFMDDVLDEVIGVS